MRLDPWAKFHKLRLTQRLNYWFLSHHPTNEPLKCFGFFVKPWGSGSQVSPCKDGHICFLYSNSSRCKRTKRLRVSDAQSSGRNRKSQKLWKLCKLENRPPQQQNSLQALASAHLPGFHLDGFLFCCGRSPNFSCCGCQCLSRLFGVLVLLRLRLLRVLCLLLRLWWPYPRYCREASLRIYLWLPGWRGQATSLKGFCKT